MINVTRSGEFFAQPLCLIGPGSLKRLPDFVKGIGGKKALLCTDRGVVSAGIADEVSKLLRDGGGISLEIFDRVVPNRCSDHIQI
ncbi:MAG: iron-containing alcohol dehydrogenase [Thermodesulforhabdaceae bacterium]